ncbi:MAG: acetyl-CoA carboxylase biotin carboxylase subunit [Thermoanaerobacteraceae bacterium]
MFKKILIANRGEIAVRVIRSAKEMGIKTVAIYSDIDKESIHVKLADEAYPIGDNYPHKSYLNLDKIKEAILKTGCDALHPGYGFLSENPDFAKLCENLGVTFIGPSSILMGVLSNKFNAKKILMENDLPVIPGSKEIIKDDNDLLDNAKNLGFPLLIKAAYGGGGKGIKEVFNETDLFKAWEAAKQEAYVAFKKNDIYLEKIIKKARHIEVQIASDNFGNVITLGERDCSIQRRRQKLLEESPSPVLSGTERIFLFDLTKAIVKALNYVGIGTVEFLYDGKNFYFMEINKRIQVEHPVTEMIFGIDLIREQIKIAANEKLDFLSKENIANHSIECRINAENPLNFYPSPGTIKRLYIPGGYNVRVDTALECGSYISPYYDSLIAKVIVVGKTREEARLRMLRVLDEFIIDGIETTISFHKKILNTEDFIENNYDINYIDSLLI